MKSCGLGLVSGEYISLVVCVLVGRDYRLIWVCEKGIEGDYEAPGQLLRGSCARWSGMMTSCMA